MRLRMLAGTALAVLLALTALPSAAQAAPGSGDRGSSVAGKSSGYTATSLAAGTQKVNKARVSTTKPAGAVDANTQFVNCYYAALGFDYYDVICQSDQWWTPWVFCSDGRWYAYASFLGHWWVRTYCPLGLQALAGVVTVP